MKKNFTLLFLFVIILNIVVNIEDEVVKPVFTELSTEHYLLQEKNTYNIIYLDISSLNLTTKKYKQIENLKIIGVYYDVNQLHTKFFKTNYYEFKTPDNIKNISSLNNYYLNILRHNNLSNEYNKTFIKGIKINKIKTYLSNEQLYYILKSNPNVSYSLELNKNYKFLNT